MGSCLSFGRSFRPLPGLVRSSLPFAAQRCWAVVDSFSSPSGVSQILTEANQLEDLASELGVKFSSPSGVSQILTILSAEDELANEVLGFRPLPGLVRSSL